MLSRARQVEREYSLQDGFAGGLWRLNKRLIINADGLGFTPGVDKGIWETTRFGLVRSTSAVPNFDSSENIGRFAREFPNISVGIHFNLSVGTPISPIGQIPSLVNPKNGQFWESELPRRLMTGKIEFGHMRIELNAQVQRLLDLGGLLLLTLTGTRTSIFIRRSLPRQLRLLRSIGLLE